MLQKETRYVQNHGTQQSNKIAMVNRMLVFICYKSRFFSKIFTKLYFKDEATGQFLIAW